MWDPAARLNAERLPVACELRTYRIGMELPNGHAHDNFERAAMLIHERYASSQEDRTKPASLPWDELSDFYKGSNRRQFEMPSGWSKRSPDAPGTPRIHPMILFRRRACKSSTLLATAKPPRAMILL